MTKNIRDIDLLDSSDYVDLPDITIKVDSGGSFYSDEEDTLKYLWWVVNKHRLMDGKDLLDFKKKSNS